MKVYFQNFFKNLDRAWSLKIKKVQQLSTTEGNTEVSAAELSVPSHVCVVIHLWLFMCAYVLVVVHV